MFFPLHDRNNEPVKIVPVVSYSLIAINILVFAYQILLEESFSHEEIHFFLKQFALDPSEFPSTVENLFSLISYSFLHMNFMHIFGNLWFFWIFADNVEERMGSLPFLFFYLLGAAAGGAFHLLVSEYILVGASGAIAGVMGAYIIMFPKNLITSYFCPIWFYIRQIDVPAWIVLGFFMLFQVIAFWNEAILKSDVAFGCHIGGFLTGIVVGLVLRSESPSPSPGTA